MRGFASDNNAGVHPHILSEINRINDGHTIAYGSDEHTDKAKALFREILGEKTEILFSQVLLPMFWVLAV